MRFRFGFQRCQRAVAVACQAPLPFLDSRKLGVGTPIARACLLPETRAGRGQLGGAEVEPALDEVDAGGEVFRATLPVRLDKPVQHDLLGASDGILDHVTRQGREGNSARREARGASEQQQVLDRTLFHDAVVGLAQPCESRFESLRGRLLALFHRHPRDVEQVWLGCIGIGEHGSPKTVPAETVQDRGRQGVEQRLAGMQPNRVFPGLRLVDRKTLPRGLGVPFEGGQQRVAGAGTVGKRMRSSFPDRLRCGGSAAAPPFPRNGGRSRAEAAGSSPALPRP